MFRKNLFKILLIIEGHQAQQVGIVKKNRI